MSNIIRKFDKLIDNLPNEWLENRDNRKIVREFGKIIADAAAELTNMHHKEKVTEKGA